MPRDIRFTPATFFFILTLILFSVFAAHAQNTQNTPNTYQGKQFRVTYQSSVEPLPLNSMHWWTLKISTLDGKPVEGAIITVYGGMPAHRHGLPTEPETSPTGGGTYIVKGLKFSMTGEWEVWFDITASGMNEKVMFKFKL
jgi:hypothetical protein